MSGIPIISQTVFHSIVVIAVVLIFFSAAMFWQWPDSQLHIVVCDVGQGDAILLTHGFTQVVVDAGLKEEHILRCLRNQLPFWDRQVEWIVPTHLDADHIGGFAGVLERYRVANMLIPKDTKESADFERFEAAVLREQTEGSRLHAPMIGDELHVIQTLDKSPQLKITVLYAPTETLLWDTNATKSAADLNPIESNNRSTVLSLQYGQVSLLLTGDLEAGVEQALVARGMVAEHTILKVGHHGSKSSSSEVFLSVVRPEISLVSAGKNNQYGHPAPVILERLARFGSQSVLRTDELGTIELQTDGQYVWQELNGEQKIIRPIVSWAGSTKERGEGR